MDKVVFDQDGLVVVDDRLAEAIVRVADKARQAGFDGKRLHLVVEMDAVNARPMAAELAVESWADGDIPFDGGTVKDLS